MKFLQRIGKSLMLPVAVLPICGILMGVGYLLCPASMQGSDITGVIPIIGFTLVKAGGAIIDNMSWLFAIGVSVGMSDDNHGAACLSGLVSYLVITTLLSTSLMSVIIPGLDPEGIYYIAFSKIQNPFIAIITGVLGAFCYNKYKNMALPPYFSFFSGRRFVIIAAALYSLAAALIMAVIWPLAFYGLVTLGEWILGLGGIGVGIYAFLNRLLIPFGLHHALNNVFWFDTIGIGDLTAFWSGLTSQDTGWSLGMYMSGFFPCMMFGVPGAALAMIQKAKNRKKAIGILFSAAVCAFVCGVTEPFEFAFMFAAFPLYVVYALLYGVISTVTYYTGFRAGFSFSAGATDLLFSASLPAASKTWQIIPLGIAAFVVFYLAFSLVLKKMDYPTPGNEAEEADEDSTDSVNAIETSGEYEEMAGLILKALGGKENLRNIDCCATRLRLDVKDSSIIDHDSITKAGAIASKSVGNEACQIIIGVTVQQVCDSLKKLADTADVEKEPASEEPATMEIIDLSGKSKISRGDILSFDVATTFEMIITNENGIHARPAALIADTAKRFNSDITMTFLDKTASLKSSTQIMSLGVICGGKVTITALGADEKEAIVAIREVLKSYYS